jgi:hypothetical protein
MTKKAYKKRFTSKNFTSKIKSKQSRRKEKEKEKYQTPLKEIQRELQKQRDQREEEEYQRQRQREEEEEFHRQRQREEEEFHRQRQREEEEFHRQQQQLEMERQQRSKKIFDNLIIFSRLRVFWEKLPGLDLPWQQASSQSLPVFLINLNHGLIPVVYKEDNSRYPVIIKEYKSNINQTKVLKAPIGSCPRSNEALHHDLIHKLQKIDQTLSPTQFHKKMLEEISSEELIENEDIHDYANKKMYLMEKNRPVTERLITDHVELTYQEINIGKETDTVNKYFVMDIDEKDGGLYVLKPTTILLPFASNIRMYTSLDQFKKAPPIYLYSAGDIHFTTTVDITIISTTITTTITTTHPAGTEIILKTSDVIIYNSSYIRHHLQDMGIKSFLIDERGHFKLYPYATGIQQLDRNRCTGIVSYEAYTDIQSCPYFIEYVTKMISSNPETIKSLDLFANQIIINCTSLTYPFEHETVFAMNALMISNYFRNVERLYTYDFTCQALTLVEVPANSKYTLDNFPEILFENPRAHEFLYGYARGITKPKKKPKRTRKNK